MYSALANGDPEERMKKKYRQVMLKEKDLLLIEEIADFLEEEEGDRPKNATVIRRALSSYKKKLLK